MFSTGSTASAQRLLADSKTDDTSNANNKIQNFLSSLSGNDVTIIKKIADQMLPVQNFVTKYSEEIAVSEQEIASQYQKYLEIYDLDSASDENLVTFKQCAEQFLEGINAIHQQMSDYKLIRIPAESEIKVLVDSMKEKNSEGAREYFKTAIDDAISNAKAIQVTINDAKLNKDHLSIIKADLNKKMGEINKMISSNYQSRSRSAATAAAPADNEQSDKKGCCSIM